MTNIPIELENFEHTLVGRMRYRQGRAQRRRAMTLAVTAALLLTGTAIAATRALDQPTVAEQNHTENLGAAQTLLSGFLQASPKIHPDLGATRLLSTLPDSTGTYAGLHAYLTPTLDGGACVVLLNEASCGGPVSETHPLQAIGLGQTSTTPFLLVGAEASFVSKHLIRCGNATEDVTGNTGGTSFAYVAPNPTIDPSGCTQEFTLEGGKVVRTAI